MHKLCININSNGKFESGKVHDGEGLLPFPGGDAHTFDVKRCFYSVEEFGRLEHSSQSAAKDRNTRLDY